MRTRRLAVVFVAAVTAVATLLAVGALQAPQRAAGSTMRVLPDLPPHRSEAPGVTPDRAPWADRAPPDRAAAATPAAPATPTPPPGDVKPPATAALPADSGSGGRVVYAIGAQQVWLVTDSTVVRTYKVSGSRYDQLEPGAYVVFSRSRYATSWHGTETMEYMVRFHRGARSNIGFHDIPVDTVSGTEVQTLTDLGTPLSDGCIRQDVEDAAALWEFAPVGTPVVVVR
ncbi:MAG TPA: L,D-transpeptidase [Jiangellaceae bacterium]|nr:L,D-transpeptidase [Jiangellaceae bacterium]